MSFQSISPGLVQTEITPYDLLDTLRKNPEYSELRVEDISDAAIYVLSTPPNCEVRNQHAYWVV